MPALPLIQFAQNEGALSLGVPNSADYLDGLSVFSPAPRYRLSVARSNGIIQPARCSLTSCGQR